MIVTVTPNPSIDLTLELAELRRGTVHRATGRHVEPSGKGVNVTRALAANGVASLAVLPVGGSEGLELADLLRAEGVAFRSVPIAEPVRVNVSLTEPGGLVTKVNELGPRLSAAEATALLAAVAEVAREAAWVVGAGSLPQGVPDDFYARLSAQVTAAGSRFALDTSGPALRAGVAGGPDLVKPNAEELAAATGRALHTLADVVAAARELCAAGARAVLASLGPDGALLVTPTAVAHAEAPVGHPRSTVGAGDALLAGFLSTVGSGGAGASDGEALREAVAWASTAVRSQGSSVTPVTAADRAAVRLTDLTGRFGDRDDGSRPLRHRARPAVP
ncbi:MAG: 1-phosphofructokinase [Actinomycetota bacterium]